MVSPNFIQQQRGLTQQFNTIIGEHEQAMKDIATSLAQNVATQTQKFEQRQKDLVELIERLRDVVSMTGRQVQWSGEKIAKVQPDVPLAITNVDTKPQLEQFLAIAREKSKALETYDHRDTRIVRGTCIGLLIVSSLPFVFSYMYLSYMSMPFLILSLLFLIIDIAVLVTTNQKQKRYGFFFWGNIVGLTCDIAVVADQSLTLDTVLLYMLVAIGLLSLVSILFNKSERFKLFLYGLLVSFVCCSGYYVTLTRIEFYYRSNTNWLLLNTVVCSLCIIMILYTYFRRTYSQQQLYATMLQAQRLSEQLYERGVKMTQLGLKNVINSIQQAHNQKQEENERHFSQQLIQLKTAVANYNRSTQMSGLPWTNSHWQQWQPTTMMPATPMARLGNLTMSYRQQDIVSMAIFVPFPGKQNLLLQASHMQHQETTATVQSLLLHLFATCPAGMIRCTFIDPISFGQDIAPFMQLARYNESLVTSRVWMNTNQIAKQLSDISEYIRQVNAQQLFDPQMTIEQYNLQNRNAPLPYRILVAFGFPCNFTPEMIHTLKLIAQYGPRCGICVLLVYEPEQPQPVGFDIADFARLSTVITWEGEQIIWDNVRLSQQQTGPTSQTSQDVVFQLNRQTM